ncbi:MAG: aldehyde dehydrogenase family protein, partial [Nanoarchaeota archaeon]|nr:aldehyde dehydrogenase family protein [Nanoarchaeota archaeon]
MGYKLELSEFFSEIYEKGEFPKFKVLINGKWVSTKDSVDLISPVNGEKIAEIGSVSKEQAQEAIEVARKSQNSIRDMAGIDRIEMINKIREEISVHKEEIIKALMLESGKAYSSASGEINALIERMRLSMEDFRKIMGEYLPGDWASDTTQKFALVIREPIGVVLGISPFNYPVFTSISKAVPALLAANSVIIKPPSADPIAFLMVSEIFRKVGVPNGVFQVLTGAGSEIGDFLVSNTGINMISFTGSTAVGKHISSIAGLKKVHLELGGKAPAIILEDADIDLAARECVKGSLELAGQRCDAISRILVVEKVKDAFIDSIKRHLSDYKFGDPVADKEVKMGPVISESAAKRIDDMVRDAVKRGAKILAGGKFNKA